MIRQAKRIARKGITLIQKAFTQNIDNLYQESPYNEFMAELTLKADLEKYKPYTNHRQNFEDKLLNVLKGRYVRLLGVQYYLNRLHNNLSFREAGTDGSGLNSRMRFCLAIIDKYFANAQQICLTEDGTNFHTAIKNRFAGKLTTSIYKPGDKLHQDLTGLTYADNSFDLCMSFEDLEHIPNYKKAIAELYRVTTPGWACFIEYAFCSRI